MSRNLIASFVSLALLSAALPVTAAVVPDQTYNPAVGSAAGYQIFSLAAGNPTEQKGVGTFTAGLSGRQTTPVTFVGGNLVYTQSYAAGLWYFWNPSLSTFRHNASTASLRFTTFVDVPAALPGDYNADGYVDAADYTVWADAFGQTGSGLRADGNNDNVVDAADYTIWADHFGAGTPPSGTSGAVPEPSSMAFAAAASLAVLCRRR